LDRIDLLIFELELVFQVLNLLDLHLLGDQHFLNFLLTFPKELLEVPNFLLFSLDLGLVGQDFAL
jgi:hypothetical protein